MFDLKRFGVKESKSQFERVKTSGTLSLDADGLLYEAVANAAKLETALRRAKIKILEMTYLTGVTWCRAHLTARTSTKAGRTLIQGHKGPYQGNRKGKAKPPLLEPLRAAMAVPGVFDEDDGVEVLLHHDVEADDAMMMDCFSIPDVKVASPDKDLRICPVPWYNMKDGTWDVLAPDDTFGWIDLDYSTSTVKVVGHGTKFFWAQMLMGDAADNVAGLSRYYGDKVGPAKAFQILRDTASDNEAAEVVLQGYMAAEQNPCPEADMLWLLRTPDDSGSGFLWSLDLPRPLREFVQWGFNEPYKQEQQDETQDSSDDLPPWD